MPPREGVWLSRMRENLTSGSLGGDRRRGDPTVKTGGLQERLRVHRPPAISDHRYRACLRPDRT